jgi:integrase
MARTIHRLSATKLTTLKTQGLHCDGGGLYFRVAGASRGWIFRYALHGATHDMGLSSYPEISLAAARKQAFEYRQMLAAGTDPLAERNAKRAAARVENATTITFDDCAKAYHAAHADGWRSAKHRQQWATTIESYASPVFGRLPVRAIDTGLVLRALEPIWKDKPETASRLRGRIESILNWAEVRGFRAPGKNPAAWRGHLSELLPARSKIRKVEHHAALSYAEVGKFVKALRRQEGVAVKALEFLILTAARAGEVLGATWDEVDFATRTWTIPAGRMKGGREHRVPLSNGAIAVLRAMQEVRRGDYVVEGAKQGRPLSQVSLFLLLRRMGHGDVTSHGFRSSFRDWAAERTNYENHVVEQALAHAIGNQVEAAYRRGDLFDKRRRLMDDWAEFCAIPSAPEGKVLPIGRRK